MFMSMGRDDVSELRPPAGVFISLVIFGELWWNDVDRGQLMIRPPERSLAIPPAEPSSSKSRGSGEKK
jgi:hypothetical protein